jgi:hypothetical protein
MNNQQNCIFFSHATRLLNGWPHKAATAAFFAQAPWTLSAAVSENCSKKQFLALLGFASLGFISDRGAASVSFYIVGAFFSLPSPFNYLIRIGHRKCLLNPITCIYLTCWLLLDGFSRLTKSSVRAVWLPSPFCLPFCFRLSMQMKKKSEKDKKRDSSESQERGPENSSI